MRTILLPLLAAASLLAQTPAPKPAVPAKKPAAAPGPNRALLNPALLKAKAPEVYKADFTTTKGDIVIEVHRDWAPLGADRFYNLVKAGFFTDASFFRAISGFMVQFGISAYPQVSKAWLTASVKDDPVKGSNTRGYVTFATSGPNSRTTQLFINLGDNARLDAMGFSPIGTVVDGMDVVDQLYMGYGEGAPQGTGPDQEKVNEEGKAYLDKNFPQLDSIKSARIVGSPAPAPAQKPSPAKPTTTTTKPPAGK